MPAQAIITLDARWRVTEDGERQWIVQRRKGQRWRDEAFCGTRAGLLDVALPAKGIAPPGPVLAALRQLPANYRPGPLAVAVGFLDGQAGAVATCSTRPRMATVA